MPEVSVIRVVDMIFGGSKSGAKLASSIQTKELKIRALGRGQHEKAPYEVWVNFIIRPTLRRRKYYLKRHSTVPDAFLDNRR